MQAFEDGDEVPGQRLDSTLPRSLLRAGGHTATMSVDVTVLGSANLDVVLRVAALPRPGETALAQKSERHSGGKGLNQAVASSRAGARTAFVARVGRDDSGQQLIATLRDAGVDVSGVEFDHRPTGVATIVVADSGENTIVVDGGANTSLTTLPPAGRRLVAGCRLLVVQFEVPPTAVAEAAALARAAGVRVLLNAAPAAPVDDALLSSVDVLVVNEHEALAMVGGELSDPLEAGRRLTERVPDVVVTLGAAGAAHLTAAGDRKSIAGLPARAVDTTGAGDTFVGSLAASLVADDDMATALRRAVAAGALSVEVRGAVPSIPTRAAVDARLGLTEGRP